ncbi:methionine aminopeptidase [Peribacillus sp. B-H-3]|uniref:hypothetical protein n=1 Tax=Bacillaceae TaxID=186817 RepID=UPI0008F170CD|nr:hypothetical protein [Bacillus sp. OV322]SFC90715.1 hypothetical protein SAMN05443252_10841 [Bacillus sp. OV322]
MGLFSAIASWNAARQAKFISEMESKGWCPDCRGKGFSAYAPNEYYYNSVLDCPGCDGTGSYASWSETNGLS